jgi:hypothetical protein
VTSTAPEGRGAHPAELVTEMVERVLALAETWPRWDGTPAEAAPPEAGEPPRTYTPHKAIRRVADHLLDHLAEMEARLAGRPTEPDHWHGSAVTTPGDLAPFTREDLDEARSRLLRLAQIWDTRLRALDSGELDELRGEAWTLREVAAHLAESSYYAEAVGAL